MLIGSFRRRPSTVEESGRLLLLCALFDWPQGYTDIRCIKEHVLVCVTAFSVLELDKLRSIQLCYCAGCAYLYWAYPDILVAAAGYIVATVVRRDPK